MLVSPVGFYYGIFCQSSKSAAILIRQLQSCIQNNSIQKADINQSLFLILLIILRLAFTTTSGSSKPLLSFESSHHGTMRSPHGILPTPPLLAQSLYNGRQKGQSNLEKMRQTQRSEWIRRVIKQIESMVKANAKPLLNKMIIQTSPS